MREVTRILNAIDHGDPHTAEQFLPLVYTELRKLAAQRLGDEKSSQTLQPTALVHEAYICLVDVDRCRNGKTGVRCKTTCRFEFFRSRRPPIG